MHVIIYVCVYSGFSLTCAQGPETDNTPSRIAQYPGTPNIIIIILQLVNTKSGNRLSEFGLRADFDFSKNPD